jgi:hypothetical protein
VFATASGGTLAAAPEQAQLETLSKPVRAKAKAAPPTIRA